MFKEILVKKEYSSSHLTDEAELQMGGFIYKNYIRFGRDVKIMREKICNDARMLNHFYAELMGINTLEDMECR